MVKTKCIHDKNNSYCKECKILGIGGKKICDHGRIRYECKDCGGSQRCEHGRIRSKCKDCDGSQRCEHGRIRSTCKDCGGSQMCEHGRIRSTCKDCGGGGRCEHDKRRSTCKDCGGGSRCEHKRRRDKCKDCDFFGYLAQVCRSRVYSALKNDKDLHTTEYLDCSVEVLRSHIENQFKDGMTWDNYGEWHIDHIVPIKYRKENKEPCLEEIIKRLHYKNLQPLWASDNISKGNRFIG